MASFLDVIHSLERSGAPMEVVSHSGHGRSLAALGSETYTDAPPPPHQDLAGLKAGQYNKRKRKHEGRADGRGGGNFRGRGKKLLHSELRPLPQRKESCRFYGKGGCKHGHECRFSHALPLTKKADMPCKFQMTNNCLKSDLCVYSHDFARFPCRYVHTGKPCPSYNCRFSHDPLTEESRVLLENMLRDAPDAVRPMATLFATDDASNLQPAEATERAAPPPATEQVHAGLSRVPVVGILAPAVPGRLAAFFEQLAPDASPFS